MSSSAVGHQIPEDIFQTLIVYHTNQQYTKVMEIVLAKGLTGYFFARLKTFELVMLENIERYTEGGIRISTAFPYCRLILAKHR